MRPTSPRSLVFICAVLAMTILPRATANATFPGRNGRIVTWAYPEYGAQIISTNPDGTGRKELTGDEHLNRIPKYSPDGRQIVYSRDYELWLMNANGSDKHVLVRRDGRTHGGTQGTWAPDGNRIVFIGLRYGSGTLYIKRPGHPGVRLITRRRLEGPFLPMWSPLGDRIIFSSHLGGGVDDAITTKDLWSIRPNGSGLQQVTDTNADEVVADWSPDGRWILFSRKESPDYRWELWRSHPDGSHQQFLRILGDPCCVDPYPSYSPNGRLIVFYCKHRRTCMMDADGGEARVIGTDFYIQPSWQPRP